MGCLVLALAGVGTSYRLDKVVILSAVEGFGFSGIRGSETLVTRLRSKLRQSAVFTLLMHRIETI